MSNRLRSEWPGLLAGAILVALGLFMLRAGCTVEVHAQAATSPVVDWKPGTKLVAGGFYRLPDGMGVNIRVDAPDVTFLGGWVWPDRGAAFEQRAEGLTVIGTRFHHPNPPTKRDPRTGALKRDMPAVLVAQAKGYTLLRCSFGTVGAIVNAMPGADEGLVARNVSNGDNWSQAVGVWGADRTTIVYNDFPECITENLIRFSPQNVTQRDRAKRQEVPEGAVVAFNKLANNRKSPCDVRHITDCFVGWNTITADENNAAVGIANTGFPGATNVYVVGNEILRGVIFNHGHGDRLVIDDNRFRWANKPANQAIYMNTSSGVLQDLRVTNNVIESPVRQKPVLGFSQVNGSAVRPQYLDDRGNVSIETPLTPVTPAAGHH